MFSSVSTCERFCLIFSAYVNVLIELPLQVAAAGRNQRQGYEKDAGRSSIV